MLNHPYTLLAQTRSELTGAYGRVITYTLSLLAALDWMTPEIAALVIVQASFLSLMQNIFTPVKNLALTFTRKNERMIVRENKIKR